MGAGEVSLRHELEQDLASMWVERGACGGSRDGGGGRVTRSSTLFGFFFFFPEKK
jgi:hypothetical protein